MHVPIMDNYNINSVFLSFVHTKRLIMASTEMSISR